MTSWPCKKSPEIYWNQKKTDFWTVAPIKSRKSPQVWIVTSMEFMSPHRAWGMSGPNGWTSAMWDACGPTRGPLRWQNISWGSKRWNWEKPPSRIKKSWGYHGDIIEIWRFHGATPIFGWVSMLQWFDFGLFRGAPILGNLHRELTIIIMDKI
jgi:hypothetical protein